MRNIILVNAMANKVETAAMRFVNRWAKSKGITARDVSRKGLGYDYRFTHPGGKTSKIEVKGISKTYGIPDMRVNEFSRKHLKADCLLVVGNAITPGKERLYKIPRNAIKPRNLLLLQTYRLTRFQGKKNMEKYRVVWPQSGSKSKSK